MVFVVNRLPSELHVAEEDHPIWPPVLNRVRKNIWVHKRAPGLSGEELPKFAIGVTQTKSRLARIHPTPNNSNSNTVFRSPSDVGTLLFTPKRDCRTTA